MKERLDKILLELGYFDNKSKAAAAILAGNVKINEQVITKAGFQINKDDIENVDIKSMPYVSRGGFKLEKALKKFNFNPKNRVCFDAGASTGGFSDVLLQNDAKFVYAVDVGYGQLAWKIRADERVKTVERTNIKNCNLNDVYDENDPLADLLVMDVSFISIQKVLPNLKKLLNPNFHEMICLIKPQFEAGKNLVDKGGVVRDKNVHYQVINNLLDYIKTLEYTIINLTYSSIKGPSGNIEYLVYFATEGISEEFSVKAVVDEAFDLL